MSSISTVQRPMPRTWVRCSMMSSSDMRRMRASVGTVPSRVLAARSRRARDLVVREAGGAELFVGAIEQMLGCGVVADAADGVEAFEQTAMDGRGGFAVELLVDDALDQGFERVIVRWRRAG